MKIASDKHCTAGFTGLVLDRAIGYLPDILRREMNLGFPKIEEPSRGDYAAVLHNALSGQYDVAQPRMAAEYQPYDPIGILFFDDERHSSRSFAALAASIGLVET